MATESKRQLQIAEMIKRNFSIVLQQEGNYIYGSEALVTVTTVKVSPDLSQGKIYLSVYNTDNKQAVILLMEEEYNHLKQALAHRIKKHIRKIPQFQFFLDDTLDEMYKLNSLFNKLHLEKQMGDEDEEDANQE